jgi:tRNA pseudouridine32 synthase/23S rRNA pseudouridine746 synthase
MPEQKQWTCTDALDGKKAISHFTVCEPYSSQTQSVLDVIIETGRKHQIRRHLASSGLPIIGDRLYGHEQGETPLHLISYYLQFQSPFDHAEKCYQLEDAQLTLG